MESDLGRVDLRSWPKSLWNHEVNETTTIRFPESLAEKCAGLHLYLLVPSVTPEDAHWTPHGTGDTSAHNHHHSDAALA